MKLLCVEDGSIPEKDFEKLRKKYDILVYRQGSNQPYLIDNKDDLKDLYNEIKENGKVSFGQGIDTYYTISTDKLRQIFEKRIKGE